jgi:coenzyme F420-reducing hydrogenase delta subunit
MRIVHQLLKTVILHEIIHRHTVNTIKNNPELYARLDKLYKYLLTPNPDIPVDAQKYYGMHNMFELLTEGMTNPLFQGYLKSIKYDAGGTLWQEFLNLVNKALEHLGVKVSSTALDEVISIVSSSAISGNIGDLYIELSKAATNEFSTAPADKLASIFDSFSNKIAQYKSSGLLDDATSKNMIRLINQLMADRARSLELIETNEKTITISGHAVEVGDYVLFGGAIGSSSNVEALRKITGIGVDRSGNKIALSVYNNVITKIKDGDNVFGGFKTIAEYDYYQTQRASGVAEAQQEHFTPIILGNSVNDYDYK